MSLLGYNSILRYCATGFASANNGNGSNHNGTGRARGTQVHGRDQARITLTRREWLQGTAGTLVGLSAATSLATDTTPPEWQRQVGVTTGSFMKHLSVESAQGKLRLLDLPRIMRDELGMKVIDLMTATLASWEPSYVDQLRNQAEKHSCVLTNLKLNLAKRELGTTDDALRTQSLADFKQAIDVAERLGVRWVRPAPGAKRPDMDRLVADYRELIAYAAPKGIKLLVENNGWMRDDPTAIPTLIERVGSALSAAPDTGNWTDSARYAGLAQAFPHAVTCDFKAFQLGPKHEHPQYDLRRCFDIAWNADFRGPWCLEHFNETLAGLFRGMIYLREQLTDWMKTAT